MKKNIAGNFVYPEYMDVIYEGLYDDDDWCKKMDGLWSCKKRALLQYQKLVNELTYELSANQKVCQFGVVFGNQIDETALAIGSDGEYVIFDINNNVISRTSDKYGKLYKNLRFVHGDAATDSVATATYDAVICFFLLSMVPLKHKKDIINNALKILRPGGKAIFIDWHNPSLLHPLRLPVKLYNRLHHPFAEYLWDHDIKTISENNSKSYLWKKSLLFGGMFQKTTVIRIIDKDNGGYDFSFL